MLSIYLTYIRFVITQMSHQYVQQLQPKNDRWGKHLFKIKYFSLMKHNFVQSQMLLALLLLTGTVVEGNWPKMYSPQRPTPIRYIQSPAQPLFSRQQLPEINLPRLNQLPVGYIADNSAPESEGPLTYINNNNNNNNYNDYNDLLCSSEEAMQYFCPEIESNGNGRRTNYYFTNKNNNLMNAPQQKRFDGRAPMASCNCRSRVSCLDVVKNVC